MFNALIIDYLGSVLRTLGHHPTRTYAETVGSLSFVIAMSMLSFFTYEMCVFYTECVTNYKKKSKELTPYDKSMREHLYEGIKIKAVNASWFCRTYNFFFLARMLLVIGFIFNLQYMQIFQVIGSFAVMLGFTIATFYYNKKFQFFESKFTKVFRLIQECSMTLLISLICVFYYNNNFDVLNQETKTYLVMFFITLISINILLEIANAFTLIGQIIRSKCKKK
jgi:hypothetical protein